MENLIIHLRVGALATNWEISEELYKDFMAHPGALERFMKEKIERMGFPSPKLSGGHERHDGSNWDFTAIPCC
jgi:hypothetical protein